MQWFFRLKARDRRFSEPPAQSYSAAYRAVVRAKRHTPRTAAVQCGDQPNPMLEHNESETAPWTNISSSLQNWHWLTRRLNVSIRITMWCHARIKDASHNPRALSVQRRRIGSCKFKWAVPRWQSDNNFTQSRLSFCTPHSGILYLPLSRVQQQVVQSNPMMHKRWTPHMWAPRCDRIDMITRPQYTAGLIKARKKRDLLSFTLYHDIMRETVVTPHYLRRCS